MTATDICRVLIAAVSLIPVRGLGQRNNLPQGVWVNCDPASGKNAVVVGPIETAKNGSHAWVQVVSVVAPLQGMCLNTTTLWVSKGHSLPYLPIFTQSPVYPNLEGSGMQIVDWSADGRLLLTEMWQWNTEPNDAPIPRSILVFEPQKKLKRQIDIERLIDDQKRRDCEVQFDLLGFTTDNWISLKARISTFYDVDEDETTKPKHLKCKESTQWLAINAFTQARRSIPSDFHAAHYSDPAARCPETNPSWVVDDDRIDGVVSIEGQPLKHAKIQLSSPTGNYSAVTDSEGAFLIPKVPIGSYSFVAKGWGEAHLQVRGWHRGAVNRPVLSFNSIKGCLLLIQTSN